jgi:hypothetical protein
MSVEIDYDSEEFRRFRAGYKGLNNPFAAYRDAKLEEHRKKMVKQRLYVDASGIMRQSNVKIR